MSLSPHLTDGETRPWVSDLGVQGHMMPVAVWTPRGWRVTRLSCPLLWTRLQRPWGAGRGQRAGTLSQRDPPAGSEGVQGRQGDQWSWLRVEASSPAPPHFLSVLLNTFLLHSVELRERLPECGCAGGQGDGEDGLGRPVGRGGRALSGDSKRHVSLVHLRGVPRGPGGLCVWQTRQSPSPVVHCPCTLPCRPAPLGHRP